MVAQFGTGRVWSSSALGLQQSHLIVRDCHQLIDGLQNDYGEQAAPRRFR